jgi:NADP-dependent 3-hydroxy acid dehydrogenase YdfG
VITGASAGIGLAVARELAGIGVRPWLIARRAGPLESAAGDIRAAGGEASTLACDLSSEAEVEAAASRVLAVGPVDLLVHSAGLIRIGPMAGAPLADFERQWAVNVRAPYQLTQRLLPSLRERRGQVVFINSSAGLRAGAGVAQYAATKHALRAVADALRAEVNADGVRVLSVFPGRTATPMQADLHDQEGRPYRPDLLMQPADVAAAVITALQLPPTAELTEIRMRPAVAQ